MGGGVASEGVRKDSGNSEIHSFILDLQQYSQSCVFGKPTGTAYTLAFWKRKKTSITANSRIEEQVVMWET